MRGHVLNGRHAYTGIQAYRHTGIQAYRPSSKPVVFEDCELIGTGTESQGVTRHPVRGTGALEHRRIPTSPPTHAATATPLEVQRPVAFFTSPRVLLTSPHSTSAHFIASTRVLSPPLLCSSSLLLHLMHCSHVLPPSFIHSSPPSHSLRISPWSPSRLSRRLPSPWLASPSRSLSPPPHRERHRPTLLLLLPFPVVVPPPPCR